MVLLTPETTCLVVLFAINLLNYMDRLTVAGVLSISDPQKAGFLKDITFQQGGLLQTSFVLTFMCLAPVFGYLGDRYNRRTIICAGIVFWSLSTLLCSFCNTYEQLLVCRALVGVGEASYATIAPTVIADMYPLRTRTKALALFYIGIPLGGAMGYSGGVIGSMFGWRWAFRMTPLVGLLMAAIGRVYLLNPHRGAHDLDDDEFDQVTEPETEGLLDNSDVATHVPIELDSDGLYAFFRDAKECIGVRSYLFSTLGFTAVTYATGALGLWGPKFIVDGTAHTPSPMSTAEASMMLGGVTAVNGVVGTICGAVLGAWLAKYSERADPLVCGLGLAVAGPFCALALQFFQHNVTLAWVFIFISEFGLCLNWALNAAILLSVIAPNRRSTAEAIQILLSHIFGDALSPYAVGIATDALVNKGISRPDAMRISLQSCSAVAILGSLCFLLCAIYYPRDKSRVKKQERAE